jgi:hypothetical protein
MIAAVEREGGYRGQGPQEFQVFERRFRRRSTDIEIVND